MGIAYFAYAAPRERIEAVRKGLGRFAPLVDPLGDDLPELEHHISAIHAVDAWLFHRKRTAGDRYRRKGLHEPYERYGMSTAEESLAALKADRPGVFEYETEECDLDAQMTPTRAKHHGMLRPG